MRPFRLSHNFAHGAYLRLATRRFDAFSKNQSGAVTVEFIICSLFTIPVFLGLTDFARANQVQQQVTETGNSLLRAVKHVPEYDESMRTALRVLCSIKEHRDDDVVIEILSGRHSTTGFIIDWVDMPCGAPSDTFTPTTQDDLDAELAPLALRNNEGFVAVKVRYTANSLKSSKYVYAPDNNTFEFFDAALPRIANTVEFTTDALYDLDEYEF